MSIVLLILASVSMYCAGMAANDIFDKAIDLEERPDRPIPSGRISLAHAWFLVVILQGTAVALAYAVNDGAMYWALGTIVATYIYNGGGKSTTLGPVFMGMCRYGNGGLGLALLPMTDVPSWAFLVFLPVAVYVIGLTTVSGYEVGEKAGAAPWRSGQRCGIAGYASCVRPRADSLPWFVALLS